MKFMAPATWSELDPRVDRRDLRVLAEMPECGTEEAGKIGVVGIEEADELTFRATKPRVSRGSGPCVGGMRQYDDVRVCPSERVRGLPRLVSRAVVDQDDLHADVALRQHGFDRGRQHAGGVEAGNNRSHQRWEHGALYNVGSDTELPQP
jgi:hypothetical protein